MATATKIKKNVTRKNLKKEYGKIHDRVINVSEETVDLTVENLEKWQKVFAKSLTASTPLVEKGIDITFTVAETMWDQYRTGGQRVKSLLGLGSKNINVKKAIKGKASKSINEAISTTKATVTKAKKVTKKVTTTAKKAQTTNLTVASIKVPTKLTDITGIGPKIADLLKEAGINNIAELAIANMKTVQNVLDKAGSRFQMHDPSTWINQAKNIIKG